MGIIAVRRRSSRATLASSRYALRVEPSKSKTKSKWNSISFRRSDVPMSDLKAPPESEAPPVQILRRPASRIGRDGDPASQFIRAITSSLESRRIQLAWRSLCAFPACSFEAGVFWAGYSRTTSVPGLGGGANVACREDCCASSDWAEGRRSRLLSSAEAGLHDGGAELPDAAMPGRD